MRPQGVFDLARRDIETTGDDELLDAIDDFHETVSIDSDDVAGAEPWAAVVTFGRRHEHLRRLLGLVPIAGKHLRAAHDQFALVSGGTIDRRILGVDDARLCVGQRQSHGARPAARAHRIGNQNGARLGETVALDQVATGAFLPGFDDGCRQRHGPRDRDLDALQRHSRLIGRSGEPLVDRRHRWQECGRMLLHDLEHQVGVEFGKEHQPRSHAHREREAEGEPVGMKHRQHGVDHRGTAIHRRHPGPRLGCVGCEVEMSEDGPPRRAGRAARVLDQRDIRRRRPEDVPIDRGVIEERRPGDSAPHRCGQRGARLSRLRDRQPQ